MSETKRVRIGILGAGHIAQIVHLPLWDKIDGVEIVSICDRVKPKAKWVAERFKIPHHCTDPETLFDNPEIDAIDICTETFTHKELSIAALSAGKHVLVEKPMALNYAEAQAMADAADEYERQLMVAMNVRFRRDAITLKSFVDGDELGDVFYAKSGWVSRRDLSRSADHWLYDRKRSGGGVLMDLGIQMLDVAMWLLGNELPVRAKAVLQYQTPGISVEDTAVCLLHYPDGRALTVEVSWTILSEKDLLFVDLHGTKATALINPLRVYKDVHGELINITPAQYEGANIRYRRSYRNELRHFVNCLHKKIPMQAGAREIAQRLRVIEALYRSAEEGKEVEV